MRKTALTMVFCLLLGPILSLTARAQEVLPFPPKQSGSTASAERTVLDSDAPLLAEGRSA
jgi:hypothetical protein